MNDRYSFQYMNDWQYLQRAHQSVLSDPHPFELQETINAAFCRLLAIHIVGSVEAILQYNPELLGVENSNKYFKRGTDNQTKIDILIDGISNLWSSVNHDIITDFIAIKIIRNSIVHSLDLETNRELLERRGFPVSPNLLDGSHWDRMCQVYREMIRYLVSKR